MNEALKRIQDEIDNYKQFNDSVGELSDGYHTYNELYKHRVILTALAFIHIPFAWKSKIHEDGTMFDGMFIVGCPTPDGMITYHYDMEYWNLFKIPEIPHAPKFDGHTPNDVCDRLQNYIESCGVHLINSDNYDKIMIIVEKDIYPVFDSLNDLAQFVSFYSPR